MIDSTLDEVKITRKGQTTIPIQLRKKYNLVEGSRLKVKDVGDGILLIPQKTILDLAGSGSGYDVETLKRRLDALRQEDEEN